MNFLERLNSGSKNISVKEKGVNFKAGFGFNTNALKQYNLQQDVFVNTQTLPQAAPSIDKDWLAVQNPVKFINKYLNTSTFE